MDSLPPAPSAQPSTPSQPAPSPPSQPTLPSHSPHLPSLPQVTRSMTDFVTWVDTSKIKRKIAAYNDKLDDYDLLVN